jgi:hypothetical protein
MHNVYVSEVRRISAKPRAVNSDPSAEDSTLVDAPFFRLMVRDVERELQSMPEGMRQAVMFAAVSTDNYVGMAGSVEDESWDIPIPALSRAATSSRTI